MANQILAGAVVQAGMVIAGVDADNPPYVGPVQYMPENTNDGSTTWNTIGSNLPNTRNATELTWNIDTSTAPMTAYGIDGWMFQKVSEPNIQLENSYVASLKVLNATSDLTVRVVKGNTEYGFTTSMVSSLAEQTIPAGDYTNSPQSVSMTVDIGSTLGTWDNTLMIQFASADGYGTFSIQDVLLTDKPTPPPAPASYFMVAAPYDDGGGDGAGEVYVYNTIEGDDSSPDLTIPSPSGYRAYFGHQMAQNSTHIAIAAYGENTYKGAVYLYDKSDLTATPQRIEPSGLSTYDFIAAYSLAMSDTHLVFGNFGDDSRGSNAGSAFIYNLDTMQYTELFPPGSGSNIQFGFSCALSDTHVVITAAGNPAHNGGLAQNAYAWPLSSGNSYSSTPPVRFNPDQYQPINGHTIALSGGQGGIAMSGNKVFIGDTGYDAPADPVTGYNNDNTGAVYMLDMENPNADPVVFTDPSPRDNPSQDQTRQLGHSVRVSGNKLYAGAPSGGEHNSGLVLVWDIEDPSTVTKIAPSNAYYGQPNPAFGERISVQGASLLVGAPTYVESGSSIETGAAYLYNLNDLSQTGFLITNTTSNDVDRMGMGVLAVE